MYKQVKIFTELTVLRKICFMYKINWCFPYVCSLSFSRCRRYTDAVYIPIVRDDLMAELICGCLMGASVCEIRDIYMSAFGIWLLLLLLIV